MFSSPGCVQQKCSFIPDRRDYPSWPSGLKRVEAFLEADRNGFKVCWRLIGLFFCLQMFSVDLTEPHYAWRKVTDTNGTTPSPRNKHSCWVHRDRSARPLSSSSIGFQLSVKFWIRIQNQSRLPVCTLMSNFPKSPLTSCLEPFFWNKVHVHMPGNQEHSPLVFCFSGMKLFV